MKVGIVLNDSGSIYLEAAKAFTQLFDQHYVTNEYKVTEELDTCDCYVVVGNYFLNYDIDRAGPVKRYVAASGKPFMVVTGSLFVSKNPDKFIRVNVNGFTNNFASMPQSDPDRLNDLLWHWGIDTNYKRKEGADVVIAPNALTSPMMFGQDVDKWVYHTVERLVYETSRPISVRYHRKQLKNHSDWHVKLHQGFGNRINYTIDSKNDLGPLNNNHCVITYNSTFSVLSLLTGTSNIACHPGNFVYNVVGNEVREDNLNYYPDREQLIDHYGKLANMEWSVDEIKDGTAWKVLAPLVEANERKNMLWLGEQFV